MAFKSLCSLWSLLLILQHALSFSLEQHCARRCLFGRGGILCNCNAIHFTGKRSSSLGSQLSDLKPHTFHDNPPEGFVSILNRPEYSHRGGEFGFSGPTNPDGVMVRTNSPDTDEPHPHGLEEDISELGLGASQSRIHNGKLLGDFQSQESKSPLYRYNRLSRELAKVVKNIWKHMPPRKGTNDDQSASSSSSANVNSMAEGYDTGDASETTNEESDGNNREILDNNQVRIMENPSLANVLKDLINKLPSVVKHYNDKFERGSDNEANGVEQSQLLGQSSNGLGLSDFRANDLHAWNRLMRFLEHNMVVRERNPLLHRTKRDQSKTLSNTGIEKSD